MEILNTIQVIALVVVTILFIAWLAFLGGMLAGAIKAERRAKEYNQIALLCGKSPKKFDYSPLYGVVCLLILSVIIFVRYVVFMVDYSRDLFY